MTAAITIDRLHHRCHLLGNASDTALVARELQHLSAQHLPNAIDRALARHLQTLIEGSGVLCVRRLQLRLRLSRRELMGQQLSDRMAEQLATSLAHQLAQASDNWVYFASTTDYCAQLIADLLHACQDRLWAYREYPALRHLQPFEAVVQLLLPRLAELPQLIAALRRLDALSPLLAKLDADSARQLLHHWCDADPTRLFSPQDPYRDTHSDDPWHLASWQVGSATNSATSWTVAGLRTWLVELVDTTEAPIKLRQGLWRQTQRAFVYLNRHCLRTWLTQGTFTDRPVATGDLGVMTQLQHWVDGHTARRDYLHRALLQLGAADLQVPPALQVKNPAEQSTQQAATPDQTATSGDHCAHFSEHAGLVLLMPVIISLGLQRTHSTRELRLAVQMATGLPAEDAEPWLELLLPDPATQPTTPYTGDLPPRWQLGLSAARLQQVEALQGPAQLAELLLGHFAARLSGLQLSSDDYLRRQFLRRPGWIFSDPEPAPVRVHLAPIPLGIVLRMSGFANWCERLPWLEHSLHIQINAE